MHLQKINLFKNCFEKSLKIKQRIAHYLGIINGKTIYCSLQKE